MKRIFVLTLLVLFVILGCGCNHHGRAEWKVNLFYPDISRRGFNDPAESREAADRGVSEMVWRDDG